MNNAGKTEYLPAEEGRSPIRYKKIKATSIQALNIRPENIQILEESNGKCFSWEDPKRQETKLDKICLYQSKKLWVADKTTKRVQDQPVKWEKILCKLLL